MSQEPQQTRAQAADDDLLLHPVVTRRRAQWQRLTEPWQPLSVEETTALMDWMRKEARRQKRWRYIIRLLLSGFLVGLLVEVIGHHFWNWNLIGYARLINLISVINLLLMLAWNSEAHKKKLAALTSLTDVHLVGPLCEIAVSATGDLCVLAREALIRLLPRLTSSDAAHFTAEQRASLYALLYVNDFALVRVILKSLNQTGDGTALPYVQNLAAGRYLAARDLRVRVVAENCLPFLEARARQQQISQTLLRPAEEGSGDTLLRATIGVTDTSPRQLLRATLAPPEDG